jgi:hypothetical protein
VSDVKDALGIWKVRRHSICTGSPVEPVERFRAFHHFGLSRVNVPA